MDKRMPGLVYFDKIGANEIGFLSVASSGLNLPFEVKRAFWTYGTPSYVMRGKHAHKETEMIIVALKGVIRVNCNNALGFNENYTLSDPNTGLYIPPMFWHTMLYEDDAIQLVLTNTEYDENDYIRDQNVFTKMNTNGNIQ